MPRLFQRLCVLIRCRRRIADRRLQTVAHTPKLISEEIKLNRGITLGLHTWHRSNNQRSAESVGVLLSAVDIL